MIAWEHTITDLLVETMTRIEISTFSLVDFLMFFRYFAYHLYGNNISQQ